MGRKYRKTILQEMRDRGLREYTVLAVDRFRQSGDWSGIGTIRRSDVGRVLVLTKDPATGRRMLQMR